MRNGGEAEWQIGKRNIQMKLWVTEEEKRLIDEKMAQLPTKRYEAYLRKMAIDGYIVQVDTTDHQAEMDEIRRDWSRYGSYKDASY